MKQISRFSGIATAVCGALLLAACAANSPTTEMETGEPAAPLVDENGERVLKPNPYLAEPASVPAAAQQAIAQARAQFGQQQYAAAESTMQQVVTQWPQLSGAWLNLAKVQLKLQQPEAAEHSLQQAVAANTNNVFAWNSLGVLLRDQGRFDEA
ncbi:tetratricopeptide repeat protein, partial [Microbulbifer mangrovi]|uniref:tetratricopeptide repeat protein n=1 Tax=Microbulbifer mangrovi TaxID=927787 RepID=UPI001301490E